MSTGAIKNDAADAKVRLDLFPPSAMYGISTVFTYGAAKYDDWNWAKGFTYDRLYSALQRHMLSWWMGQDTDPETGFSHLWHAGCNIAMLIHTELLDKPELDNRPTKFFPSSMTGILPGVLKFSDEYRAMLKKKQEEVATKPTTEEKPFDCVEGNPSRCPMVNTCPRCTTKKVPHIDEALHENEYKDAPLTRAAMNGALGD